MPKQHEEAISLEFHSKIRQHLEIQSSICGGAKCAVEDRSAAPWCRDMDDPASYHMTRIPGHKMEVVPFCIKGRKKQRSRSR